MTNKELADLAKELEAALIDEGPPMSHRGGNGLVTHRLLELLRAVQTLADEPEKQS